MAKKKEKRLTVDERLKALRFYGTGDEAGEAFEIICSLAVRFGEDCPERSDVLLAWAEEDAVKSKDDAKEHGSLEDCEVVDGYGEWVQNTSGVEKRQAARKAALAKLTEEDKKALCLTDEDFDLDG